MDGEQVAFTTNQQEQEGSVSTVSVKPTQPPVRSQWSAQPRGVEKLLAVSMEPVPAHTSPAQV